MSLRLNKYLFTQTSWTSEALTPLVTVAHTPAELGKYNGVVLCGKETVGLFDLVVEEKTEGSNRQIDLQAIVDRRITGGDEAFHVQYKKPVFFYVPSGKGGYSVVLFRYEGKKKVVVFDSRKLNKGDVFMFSPVRRGKYAMTNGRDFKGEIHVEPPSGKSIAIEPAVVECTEKGCAPKSVKVVTSQPIIFVLHSPASFKIALEESKQTPPKRYPPKRRRGRRIGKDTML